MLPHRDRRRSWRRHLSITISNIEPCRRPTLMSHITPPTGRNRRANTLPRHPSTMHTQSEETDRGMAHESSTLKELPSHPGQIPANTKKHTQIQTIQFSNAERTDKLKFSGQALPKTEKPTLKKLPKRHKPNNKNTSIRSADQRKQTFM